VLPLALQLCLGIGKIQEFGKELEVASCVLVSAGIEFILFPVAAVSLI